MSKEFPPFRHSNAKVARIGKALEGDLDPDTMDRSEIDEIFRIAYDWIDSHDTPMKRIRREVSARMGDLELDGVVAARLKRMHSIRKKLRTISAKLHQIQDLGGCRAVLPSIADVDRLVANMKQNAGDRYFGEKDYIRDPKFGGYRSYHLIFQHNASDQTSVYNGRRVEIQIRTRMQHSWATAVEAVGLIRQEDFKGGQGDEEWLRLFDLMSSELAIAELKNIQTDPRERRQRIDEIKALNKSLGAVSLLENFRQSVRSLDYIPRGKNKPSYYLLEYNYEKRTIQVIPKYTSASGAVDSYRSFANAGNLSGIDVTNSVLVQAEQVEDLKEAYPNYFGDVYYFSSNLQKLVNGQEAVEYTMPPVHRRPREREQISDLAWLRPGSHRRWN